jgi:hypothetical protein
MTARACACTLSNKPPHRCGSTSARASAASRRPRPSPSGTQTHACTRTHARTPVMHGRTAAHSHTRVPVVQQDLIPADAAAREGGQLLPGTRRARLSACQPAVPVTAVHIPPPPPPPRHLPRASAWADARRAQVRQPYDWTGMLRNPMVLIMGFMLLMSFVMPKMMANMGTARARALARPSLASPRRGAQTRRTSSRSGGCALEAPQGPSASRRCVGWRPRAHEGGWGPLIRPRRRSSNSLPTSHPRPALGGRASGQCV